MLCSGNIEKFGFFCCYYKLSPKYPEGLQTELNDEALHLANTDNKIV